MIQDQLSSLKTDLSQTQMVFITNHPPKYKVKYVKKESRNNRQYVVNPCELRIQCHSVCCNEAKRVFIQVNSRYFLYYTERRRRQGEVITTKNNNGKVPPFVSHMSMEEA
eukprot:322053_1